MVPTLALEYYYLKMKHLIKVGQIKGLKAKNILYFVKQMDNLEKAINENRVIDYLEVINEYK